MKALHRFLATGFFSGYFPFASGTAGSAVYLAIIVLAREAGGWRMGWTSIVLAGAVMTALAIWTADVHSKNIGEKDPGEVVIDEGCGLLFTFLFVDWQAAPAWMVYGLAFFWFRIFDIVKLPPARQLERLPGGWGIVLDDVAAGLYAGGVLAGLLKLKTMWLP